MLALVSVKLLLDIDPSVSNSCQRGQRNLELLVTEGTNADSRSAAQPFHHAQSTFPHTPIVADNATLVAAVSFR